MTKHFNKKSEKEKRRLRRKNMPHCEKLLWMYLRKKQFVYRFLRQYFVDQYAIDFYSPKLKLAIESDGNVHDEPDQKKYNMKGKKILRSSVLHLYV